MSDTYTELYVQLVFAVKDRRSLILEEWEGKLFAYISSIVRNPCHHVIAINGAQDHIHLLLSLHPDQSISDLVRDVKSNSSRFVNDQGFVPARKFGWQRSYAAFSYAKSQVPQVKAYVLRQKEHHRTVSFKEEIMRILEGFGIQTEEAGRFEWIESDVLIGEDRNVT